jgi:protein-export membrane protein SecD
MQRHPGFIISIIIIVAVGAGVFAYPKQLGQRFMPWQLGLDLVGGSHLVYEVDLSKVAQGDQESVLNGLRDVIERRVNLFGVSEPNVVIARSAGKANLIVELAGVKEISQAIQQIGATPFLEFYEMQGEGELATLLPTELNGRFVTGAQLSFDQTTQAPQVSVSFSEEGGKIFETLTERNVGKPIAILLDGQMIQNPVVREKITGGQAVISGGFNIQSARDLVERFNAGALPAPVKLVNQQTVSATLGIDSLRKTAVAGVIGTLLVMIFMIMYYRRLGMFACIALLIYIVLTLGFFKLISITLSLAGLAGFILTIGMAVDANILIFERIQEESARGLRGNAALAEGFKRAWPSIRDSNTSTIITAVILYFFTTSFVRGFALTLLIGVLVSMFSAITTTRLLLRVFLKTSKPT